ncbi:MAG: hypothetical protein JST16_06565 [Bdellovibrionales bacterium]|nr:hypothetical protein [Bdellovibrionales bacterium]
MKNLLGGFIAALLCLCTSAHASQDRSPQEVALTFFTGPNTPMPEYEMLVLASFKGHTAQQRPCYFQLSSVNGDLLGQVFLPETKESASILLSDFRNDVTYKVNDAAGTLQMQSRPHVETDWPWEHNKYPFNKLDARRIQPERFDVSVQDFMTDDGKPANLACTGAQLVHPDEDHTPPAPKDGAAAPLKIVLQHDLALSASADPIYIANGQVSATQPQGAFCELTFTDGPAKTVRAGRETVAKTSMESDPATKLVACQAGEARCQDGWKTLYAASVSFFDFRNGEDPDATFALMTCSNDRFADTQEKAPLLSYADLQNILNGFARVSAQ